MQKVPQFFSAYNTSYITKHILPNKISLQIHFIFATNEKKITPYIVVSDWSNTDTRSNENNKIK